MISLGRGFPCARIIGAVMLTSKVCVNVVLATAGNGL